MYNFDSITLKMFLTENLEFFIGARIQKVQQPSRRELLFTIRNKSESRKFYININPQLYHLCFTTVETEQMRAIQIPKSPPMFCMLLRKYLEAAKIAKVEQPQNERILEFYFEVFNELSEKIYLCLAVELMGKHSNIVLYNHDTNVIIGCAHNVGDDKSRERELFGGLPYVYPSQKGKRNDLTDIKTFYSEVLKNSAESVNTTIDKHFAQIQFDTKQKSELQKKEREISQRLKKINSSIQKIEQQLTKSDKAGVYKHYGDLIMANLYNLKDFSAVAVVVDWLTGKEIEIELDKTKTLKENANRFFTLYVKTKRKVEKLTEMLGELEVEKATVKSLSDPILPPRDISPAAKGKVISALSLPVFEIGGFKVYVGKNNKQNDYLVSKLADDADFWFHIKDATGSHVLLKAKNPSDSVILECAKLAKEYSKAKNSSKVPIIYTRRKYLKKPPKAKLGYVTYSHEKELIV